MRAAFTVRKSTSKFFVLFFFLVSKSQNEPAREELKALPLLPQYALLAL